MMKHLTAYESDKPRNQDWHVLLCMNDDHGNDTDRISAISIETIDGDEAQFCHQWNGVRGKIGESFVRIGRRQFDITGFNFCVGNLYWNLVTVAPDVGDEIMKWIKTMIAFDCEGGTVEFLAKYGIE